ncbi:MAG: type II 3-dehydroquinate dehydratase [Cryomorphaceae bacterium]|jgi:3-dehydroquinate dehydratase-2|nr:type II 3-dehydroquinate dehydratase [Cryomorphaceae bacterium]
MNLLVVNGPNLNLLGTRETQIYGNVTFEAYFETLKANSKHHLSYFQSNIEGALIDCLQQANVDGIILNAGGYSHTSVALRDCIAAISIPVVELHISNIAGREPFRHESLLSPVCKGCIFGFGLEGYRLAIQAFEL